ncbi:hypothetical protein [Clostridium sp.]|jgi:hypothetical protein|uniref:hypothetical protein n=1 Tax=Clostridium sp. TaxID=1506 RepID=UPI003EEBE546
MNDLSLLIFNITGMVLDDKELNDVSEWLGNNKENLQSIDKLRSELRKYLLSKYPAKKLKVLAESDNSDLEQLLLIMKSVSGPKKK